MSSLCIQSFSARVGTQANGELMLQTEPDQVTGALRAKEKPPGRPVVVVQLTTERPGLGCAGNSSFDFLPLREHLFVMPILLPDLLGQLLATLRFPKWASRRCSETA